MTEYVKEDGKLTHSGEHLVEDVKSSLHTLFSKINSEDLPDDVVRSIGANLSKMVAECVSTELQLLLAKRLEKENNPFWKMSDEEFEAYVNDKYDGKNVFQNSMSPQEINRYKPIIVKRLRKAMEEEIPVLPPYHFVYPRFPNF